MTPSTKNTKHTLASLAALAEPNEPPPRVVNVWLEGNKTVQGTIKLTRQGKHKPDIHVIELEKVTIVSQIAKNELGLDFDMPLPAVPIADVCFTAGKYTSNSLARSLGWKGKDLNDDEIAWLLEHYVGKRIEVTARTHIAKSGTGATYTGHVVKLLDPSIFDEEGELLPDVADNAPSPPVRDDLGDAMKMTRVMRGNRTERAARLARYFAEHPDNPANPANASVQPLILDKDGDPTECVICGRCYCDHPRAG